MSTTFKINVIPATKIVEVRETVSGSHSRYSINPGEDYSERPQEVRDVCDVEHTAAVIAAYQAMVNADPFRASLTAPRRIGKPREFLDLFTEAEQAAFFIAEASDVTLKLWWAKASTGDFSLDHPTVALGLAGLVQAGILTQARADEILEADFNAA